MSKGTVIVKGMSVTSALLVLFVALKLCSVISWSWWWVLSPIWLPVVITIASPLILVAIALGIIAVCTPIIAAFFLAVVIFKLCTGK